MKAQVLHHLNCCICRHIRGQLAILKEEWEEPSDSKTSVLSYLLEMDGVLIWKTWGLYLIVLEVPS